MEQIDQLCDLLTEETRVCAALSGVLREEQAAVVRLEPASILVCLEQRQALQDRLLRLAGERRALVRAVAALARARRAAPAPPGPPGGPRARAAAHVPRWVEPRHGERAAARPAGACPGRAVRGRRPGHHAAGGRPGEPPGLTMAIDPTLGIAAHALIVDQAALGVVGNNIANVNTPGYTRQVPVLSGAAGVGGCTLRLDGMVLRRSEQAVLYPLLGKSMTAPESYAAQKCAK